MIGSSILVIHRGCPPLLVRIWCASGPKRLANSPPRSSPDYLMLVRPGNADRWGWGRRSLCPPPRAP